MVAEHSIYQKRKIVKFFEEIRKDNAGMSNDKYYKIISLKVKGFLRNIT